MDTPISVLLVDDEPGIVELGRILLERDGNMKIATAVSVDEAVSLIRSQDFDVVVSDYDMPGKNGIEIVRSLQEMDKDIPIIIFTGKGNEEIAIEALNSGVSMYLRKGEASRNQFSMLREKILDIAHANWIEKMLLKKGKMLRRQLYPVEPMLDDCQSGEEGLVAARNAQGFQFATEGKNREALKVFDSILDINPRDLPAIINKGVCQGRIGMIEDEIHQYQTALSIDPDLAIVWFNKGIAFYQAGNFERAKSSLARTFKIKPEMILLLEGQDRKIKGGRKILITGVGGASGQVLAKFFRNNTSHIVIGVDANPNAPGQIFCHEFFTVPFASDPAFIRVIRELCCNQAIDALFCTVDEELALVAANREDLPCHVLLSDSDAITACLDKWICMETLSDNRIPCAKTRLIEGVTYDELESVLGLPFIIKPRVGRGSRGVRLIRNRTEYDVLYTESAEFGTGVIAQEYLPGLEYTIDILLDAKGKYAISVPRERILTDSGVSTVGRTIHDPVLQEMARSASETMQLHFIVNVQAKRDSAGNPKIIEINPRPSGTLSLSIASSVGMPEIALEFSDGICVESIAPIIYIPGMTMFRYWEENFHQE
jgi:carbamoyl-phosphate synthase large subunit